MSQSRLEILLQFHKDDPDDPFNLYALALEYLKNDVSKSRQIFEELLSTHPKYLATYYHAAKLFQELNDKAKAIEVYEKGIQLAKDQSDAKALRELRAAYQELLYE